MGDNFFAYWLVTPGCTEINAEVSPPSQSGRLRPSRIPKSSTSPNFQKLLKGSKINLTRLLNEVKSPKSGSLIARSSLMASSSSSSSVATTSEMNVKEERLIYGSFAPTEST